MSASPGPSNNCASRATMKQVVRTNSIRRTEEVIADFVKGLRGRDGKQDRNPILDPGGCVLAGAVSVNGGSASLSWGWGGGVEGGVRIRDMGTSGNGGSKRCERARVSIVYTNGWEAAKP